MLYRSDTPRFHLRSLFLVNLKNGFCALSPWCALVGWQHGNGGIPQLLHLSVLAAVFTSWMFANIVIYQHTKSSNLLKMGVTIGVVTVVVSAIGSVLMLLVRSARDNAVEHVLLPVAGEHMLIGCCQTKVKSKVRIKTQDVLTFCLQKRTQ